MQAAGEYYELANDWAFMVPIAEMAERPGTVAAALYLYERAQPQQRAALREDVIAEIVARPSYAPAGALKWLLTEALAPRRPSRAAAPTQFVVLISLSRCEHACIV